MAKIKIKNLHRSPVTIYLPNVRFVRQIQSNQEITITSEEVIEEFNYNQGCRNFIKQGFIKVTTDDEEIKERMEQAPVDTIESYDLEDLLTKQPIAKFIQVLKNAPESLKDSIVSKAIELSIADAPHCNAIKSITGKDILKIISLQRD